MYLLKKLKKTSFREYISFASANDKSTTIVRCSYGSLLESRASFDGRRTILLMFHGFLAFRKTVTELTCDRLTKSLTFFESTEHGTYVYYTIILLLPCAFNCDFVNNLSAIDRRNDIRTTHNRTFDVSKTFSEPCAVQSKKCLNDFVRRSCGSPTKSSDFYSN